MSGEFFMKKDEQKVKEDKKEKKRDEKVEKRNKLLEAPEEDNPKKRKRTE